MLIWHWSSAIVLAFAVVLLNIAVIMLQQRVKKLEERCAFLSWITFRILDRLKELEKKGESSE